MAKAPFRPSLASIDISEEAPPDLQSAPRRAEQRKPKPEPRRPLSYRPRESIHERLEAISWRERRPIQSLIDEAVEEWLGRQG